MSRVPAVLATVVVALAVALAAPATAQKKPRKPKPACGMTDLPFTPGARWTYTFFMTQDAPQGFYVKDPETATIRVLEISADGADTVIKLEETYRKVTIATELRCNPTEGVVVPPESFFFYGEPGGGIGTALEDARWTGQRQLPGAKLARGAELYGELKAIAVRTPSEGSGAVLPRMTLELERKLIVGDHEDVETKVGIFDATRLEIELSGRTNSEGQPTERGVSMPDGRATLFVSKGIGVVRVQTSTKGWQLSEFTDGATTLAAPAATPTAPAAAPAAPAPTSGTP